METLDYFDNGKHIEDDKTICGKCSNYSTILWYSSSINNFFSKNNEPLNKNAINLQTNSYTISIIRNSNKTEFIIIFLFKLN